MVKANITLEEKKLDGKTILGFVLITGLMLWMMYNNISDQKKSMAKDTKKAKTEKVEQAKQQAIQAAVATTSDSAKAKALEGVLGSFAYSASFTLRPKKMLPKLRMNC